MAQPKEQKLVTAGQMNRLQDYWEVFGSEKGKRVFEDMKKDNCYSSCYSDNPYKMGYLNGRRDSILDIETEVLSLKDKDVIVEGEENG